MRTLFLFLAALGLAACGNGNLGDLFSAFPPEAFGPPDGGGGDGGGDGGGAFTPREVAVLAGSQGVTGTVRNIALANFGGDTYAFLAAGPDGIHVVNVTEPDILNSSDFVITIRNARLTAPAELAGGASHALAVVDNAYLVSLAVGTGAANGVTVFHIPTLIEAATSATADLTGAFVPPDAGSAIAVPGRDGKAGGVAGTNNAFFVATGGPQLGIGTITPAPLPGTWAAQPPLDPGAPAPGPEVQNFLDVIVVPPAALVASVKRDDVFGLLSATLGSPPTVLTPQILNVRDTDDDFEVVASDFVSGPGNHPLDLATDGVTNIFVSGDDDVKVFSISLQAQNPITATGTDTIAVHAVLGSLAVGAGNAVRVFTVVAGTPRPTATVTFAGTVTIRGVALLTTDRGTFVLACGGTSGLRVVQVTQSGTGAPTGFGG